MSSNSLNNQLSDSLFKYHDAILPLEELLRKQSHIPALGLEYIKEYIDPNQPDKPRLYTCMVRGCRKYSGFSDAIKNHLSENFHEHHWYYMESVLEMDLHDCDSKEKILRKMNEIHPRRFGNFNEIITIYKKSIYDMILNEFDPSYAEPVFKTYKLIKQVKTMIKAEESMLRFTKLAKLIKYNIHRINYCDKTTKKITAKALKILLGDVVYFESTPMVKFIKYEFLSLKTMLFKLRRKLYDSGEEMVFYESGKSPNHWEKEQILLLKKIKKEDNKYF